MRFAMLPLFVTLTAALTSPYPNGAYDSAAARAYFARRPLQVITRAAYIGWKSLGFAGGLVGDAVSGTELDGVRASQRGVELTDLLVQLGPAFIKIGQSASVRTDLLPPAYVKALTSLQEDVPAFSSDEARDILIAELGRSTAEALLDGLSAEPVAAASLGQVYRGTFKGEPVAVKVQRPAMTERIALDMFLVREAAAPLASLLGAPGDVQGIADAWGAGLVDELDYLSEAENAAAFNKQLAVGTLEGRVFAPEVISEASSARVLTTEWIDGERLDQTSATEDVPRLASLAMNTYMDMMLTSGQLHCDPHPGNLLRTRDGRLCILDWGLVTRLDADLRLTLIEHVAHIVARDYAKIPADLVRLGFVPAGQEQAALSAGVVDLLTYTYAKRAEGGGFSNFDVPALFDELRTLSADAGSAIFQIPPYFAYIAKAFATLEGIGLSADPQYSILNETLPYISRRILTDPSPRTAGALETFIFGEAKEDRASRVLDADRVATLVDGAKRYAAAADLLTTTSTSTATAASTSTTTSSGVTSATDAASSSPAEAPGQGSSAGRRAERAADALLDFLSEDTPASQLALEQLVLILGASSRRLWSDLRAQSGQLGGRSTLGLLVDPLGLFRGSALVRNGERDQAALDAAEKLLPLAQELLATRRAGPVGSMDGDALDAQELLRALTTRLIQRQEDLQRVTRRVAVEALDQAAGRVAAYADSVDRT